MTHQPCRAEINRANAQHSTGPRTLLGKARSAQNSFKHGLYSKELIMPDEDPDEFDHLRATLRDEHQPSGTVEEILVDELAQHFWRMRRFRSLEARAWTPENLDSWCASGLLDLIQRSMASAERSFARALKNLRQLQQDRGFVPAKPAAPASALPPDFVPQFHSEAHRPPDAAPNERETRRTWPHLASPLCANTSENLDDPEDLDDESPNGEFIWQKLEPDRVVSLNRGKHPDHHKKAA